MMKLKISQKLAANFTSKNFRSKHKGAISLVYGTVVLPVIVITLFLVFNTAQVLRNKMSLQNTADASTYSAALVYARALNFTAYTNRAMAANEAGIASLAAMHTTLGMFINSASNMSNQFSYSHYLTRAGHLYMVTVGCAKKGTAEAPATLGVSLAAVPGCITSNQESADAHWKSTKFHAKAASLHNGFQTANGILFNTGEDLLRILNYAIAVSQQVSYYASIVEIPIIAADIINQNDPLAYPTKGSANEVALGAQLTAFMLQCTFFTDAYWGNSSKGFDFSATNLVDQMKTKFAAGYAAFRTDNSEERVNEVMRFGHVAKGSRDLFTKHRQILPKFVTEGTSKYLPDTAKALAPLDWSGATDLVSEDENGVVNAGRIRWHSADRLNAKAAWNIPLGDNKAGLAAEIAPYAAAALFGNFNAVLPDGMDAKIKAYNLDAANGLESIFTQGVSTAAQGGPFSENSWKGNLLQLSTALAESRTYGGINSGNGTVLDAVKKSSKDSDGYFGIRPGTILTQDQADKILESDALYSQEATNGFRNAAFYRSIHGLNYLQGGAVGSPYDYNNIVATAIRLETTFEGNPITSSWNHGQNQSIGRVTSATPMPFFRDVATHDQEIAFEHDEGLGKAINEFNKNDIPGSIKKLFNLTDRGPSFAMTLTKDSKDLNQRESVNASLARNNIVSRFKKNQIVVLSSAGVYFRRPQDHWSRTDSPKAGKGAFSGPSISESLPGSLTGGLAGGYIEHKNLFSPYWHVRNQQPLAATRLATLLSYF